jgi:hypothetical protein
MRIKLNYKILSIEKFFPEPLRNDLDNLLRKYTSSYFKDADLGVYGDWIS